MFSRIMNSGQSPKKCRREEMTSSEHIRIVQTSSDDDFMPLQTTEERKLASPMKRCQSAAGTSSVSSKESEVVGNQTTRRVVLSEEDSSESDASSRNSSDSDLFQSEETDSDLFEKEDDSRPLGAKTVINRKSMNSQLDPQVLSESIEDDSCVLLSHKSYKRPFPTPKSVERKPNLPIRKAWKTTKRSPQTSPSKQKTFKKTVDIYSYVPSFDQLAINPLHKQQFQEWVLQDRGNCLCILYGPPGCGKVSLRIVDEA